MRRIWQGMGGALLIAMAHPAGAATELYFSEYIEGSSNNKALEIFNNTGAAVDLSGYAVQFYFNGNTSAGLTLALSGSLAQGEVYVLAHSAAAPEILAQADLSNGAGWFNGDDAVVLSRGGVPVDVIGQIGVDPGSQWGSDLTSTADNTLRRRADVDAGDIDPYDAFDPAAQWEGYAQNTFDGLGGHGGSGPGDPGEEPGEDPIGACGDPATFIHAVQGSGDASPLQGSRVTVEAVVVADFQASAQLRGFFLQEDDAEQDADPLTSEGLFVYHSADEVQVGDRVRLSGEVTEYFGLTELTRVRDLSICASGVPASTTVIELPLPGAGYLERLEGMRVTLPQALTVTENYNLARYGEVWLSSGGRLMIPTQVALPGAEAAAVQAANDLNRLLLDDASTRENPDPIVYPAPELGFYNSLRTGDSVSGLTGVIHYGFNHYRLQPTEAPLFVADNARTTAPGLPGTGSLKVASFNVLNYFNGDGLGGGFPTSRGADNLVEFDKQRTKIVNALAAMNADVIGLMEIENDGFGPESAIADLAAALSLATGIEYGYIDPGRPGIGGDAITVGLLYRRDSVAPVGAAAILDSSVDPDFVDTRNRPALAQTFVELARDERLTVVVNHLKSKGSDCNDLADPDTGDGQGNCNLTRTRAAQALVDWLAADPTGSGDPDVLIIGDLNAYAQEDPIRAITGAGFENLIARFLGEGAYSYVFNGQSGYLDHALASAALSGQVTGVSEWHINADEPRALDYNEEYKSAEQIVELYGPEPYRASDHDPVLVELDLWTPNPADVNGDRAVDGRDFLAILFSLGKRIEAGDPRDLTGDGRVTGRDLAAWLRLLHEARH